ncbi:assembly protein, partial [Vibrio parahaemolyticus]
MIYAIAGRPGGGKTYEAVAYHIIPAIKDGRKVITNITLNIDWFVKVFGEDVRELIKIVDGRLTDFGSTTRPFSQIEDYSDE